MGKADRLARAGVAGPLFISVGRSDQLAKVRCVGTRAKRNCPPRAPLKTDAPHYSFWRSTPSWRVRPHSSTTRPPLRRIVRPASTT
eukprot:2253880-Prymnesium_polylepis.1